MCAGALCEPSCSSAYSGHCPSASSAGGGWSGTVHVQKGMYYMRTWCSFSTICFKRLKYKSLRWVIPFDLGVGGASKLWRSSQNIPTYFALRKSSGRSLLLLENSIHFVAEIRPWVRVQTADTVFQLSTNSWWICIPNWLGAGLLTLSNLLCTYAAYNGKIYYFLSLGTSAWTLLTGTVCHAINLEIFIVKK